MNFITSKNENKLETAFKTLKDSLRQSRNDREVTIMNYVENVKTKVSFINIEDRKSKPVYTDNSFYNGYDYGYDLYQSMEYGRNYIESTDFGFKASLLMKKAK